MLDYLLVMGKLYGEIGDEIAYGHSQSMIFVNNDESNTNNVMHFLSDEKKGFIQRVIFCGHLSAEVSEVLHKLINGKLLTLCWVFPHVQSTILFWLLHQNQEFCWQIFCHG